jgi:DNA-binding response OmpR family regulator
MEIWEHIYEFKSEASSNVVDVYIGYLRKKIDKDAKLPLLRTVRGQGYVLGGKL